MSGLLGAVGAISTLQAEMLTDPKLGVGLTVPAGWSIRTEEGESSMIPSPAELAKYRTRRIHLEPVKGDPATLKQAAEDEARHVLERAKGKSTSNGLDSYQGAVAVRTRSGLEGLRADFTSGHEIVKYYFRNRDGRIFKVCAHVYAEKGQDNSYEKIVLDGLVLLPDNSLDFTNLPVAKAVHQAAAQARRDFEQGRYRLLAYGLKSGTKSEREKRLARYGVSVVPIAGCVVTESIVKGANAYNEAMRQLLIGKFQKDIFEEAGQ